MEVDQYLRLAGIAALSMLIATAQPVLAEKEQKSEREAVVLSGPVGKSSSASARVTLVIPPRPDKKKVESEAGKKAQASGNSKKQQ